MLVYECPETYMELIGPRKPQQIYDGHSLGWPLLFETPALPLLLVAKMPIGPFSLPHFHLYDKVS